jgi:endonuclease YncB( thermonuclease family)
MARESLVLALGALAVLGVSAVVFTADGDAKDPVARFAGAARVVDGDSLEMAGRRVRLYGIDAPEAVQTCKDGAGAEWRCGEAAREALSGLLDGHVARCESRGTDRYGRTLATCAVAGTPDLGAWMVAAGWAVAYDGRQRVYLAEESLARAAKRGLWGGAFERPADWRAARRGG